MGVSAEGRHLQCDRSGGSRRYAAQRATLLTSEGTWGRRGIAAVRVMRMLVRGGADGGHGGTCPTYRRQRGAMGERRCATRGDLPNDWHELGDSPSTTKRW